MGTSSLYDWSTTAASNASITGSSINWAENQAPSTINNSSREVMREVALWRDLLGGDKIATGTNTLALTTGLTLAAYAQGMMFAFENTTQNTGAVTINVDTIGAKDIKKFHDVALASGDLEAAGIYVIAYEATAGNFQLLSPVANAPFSDPLTTRGDVIIRGASATSRLAVGAANTVLKTDGTDPSWGTIATANIAADAVTVAKLAGGVLTDGYAGTDFDLGTNTSGTETLDYTNGNFQKGVNGGAHTLAPQATTSTIIVQYTNDGSAGTLTTSGYTIVTGDSLTTTSGHDFMMYSTRVNGFKHLHVVALQ